MHNTLEDRLVVEDEKSKTAQKIFIEQEKEIYGFVFLCSNTCANDSFRRNRG